MNNKNLPLCSIYYITRSSGRTYKMIRPSPIDKIILSSFLIGLCTGAIILWFAGEMVRPSPNTQTLNSGLADLVKDATVTQPIIYPIKPCECQGCKNKYIDNEWETQPEQSSLCPCSNCVKRLSTGTPTQTLNFCSGDQAGGASLERPTPGPVGKR